MKTVWTVAVAFAAFACPAYARQGWHPLFNGVNLDGWYVCNGTAPFTAENGAIVGRTVLDKTTPITTIEPSGEASPSKNGLDEHTRFT